jgi:hypothetical protein
MCMCVYWCYIAVTLLLHCYVGALGTRGANVVMDDTELVYLSATVQEQCNDSVTECNNSVATV